MAASQGGGSMAEMASASRREEDRMPGCDAVSVFDEEEEDESPWLALRSV
jgi:hypothetical protein